MKKLPFFALLLLVLSACKLDPVKDAWSYYEDWRNHNNEWLAEQEARTDENGKAYYQRLTSEFDRNAYVLIHYFNDRTTTEGNLSPLITSTVDVKYKMFNCDDEAMDSSYANTDSLYRQKLVSTVEGFQIAVMAMNVGDSCEVIIPYQYAYNNVANGSLLPYSHLRYVLKLKDIYKYEK